MPKTSRGTWKSPFQRAKFYDPPEWKPPDKVYPDCPAEYCNGDYLSYKRHRWRKEKACAKSKHAWAKYYREYRRKNDRPHSY